MKSSSINSFSSSQNNLTINSQIHPIDNLPKINPQIKSQENAIETPREEDSSIFDLSLNKSPIDLTKQDSSSAVQTSIVYPPLKNDGDDGFDDFVSAPPPSCDTVSRQVTLKLDQKMNLPILGN